MRFTWLRLVVVIAALSSGACSALINPDSDLLGTDPDAGPGPRLDGGGPPDAGRPDDAGPRPPGDDGGPIGRDAGPPRMDAGPPRVDAGCTIAPSCAGGVVTTCDGVLTCPLGCAPDGSARCAEMVPSNVDASYWRADANDVVVETGAEPLTFDSSTCVSAMADAAVVTQGDGSEVCVLMVRDFTVRSRSGLVFFGSRPIVIMATGDVSIEPMGYVSANARGEQPGPGGSHGGSEAAPDGGGDGRGRRGRYVPTYADGGGGGGAFCGAGGDGGSGGSAEGGAGGGRDGDVNLLIPLRGGSGGGLGSGSPIGPFGSSSGGLGGAGGGSLQISALGTIDVQGYIGAGGGGGGGGRNDTMQWGAGGGGGSGGGILLEAPTVLIGPDSAVTTSGGGGGGGASRRADGQAGENGGGTLGRAGGGSRGGSLGADGGDSGGGGSADARDGANNGGDNANGGGGGGGVGCVVYRTLDGRRPANASARTSGDDGPSLRTAPIMLR